jgi:hypothetical protein
MYILISIMVGTVVAIAWGVFQRSRGFAEGRKDGLAVGFNSGLKEGRRLEKTQRRIETIKRWAYKHAHSLLTVEMVGWKPGQRCPVCHGNIATRQYDNS